MYTDVHHSITYSREKKPAEVFSTDQYLFKNNL